jgi:hypothetical protein
MAEIAAAESTAQLTRYLAARDDFYRAGVANPKRLHGVATDPEYIKLLMAVGSMRPAHVKITGQYVHALGHPRVFGAYVLIDDCEDRSGVKRLKNGKPASPDKINGDLAPNPLLHTYRLIRARDDGAWKVSEFYLTWDKPC